MPLLTGERALHKLQIAPESAHGTGVNPTVILDVESGSIVDLDRSPGSPNLDFGGISRQRPGYGSFGVRGATLPMRGVVSPSTIMYQLRHGIAGSVAPSFAGITLATSLAADDIIDTAAPHGFIADTAVVFTALTGGAGLTALTTYYVIAANLAATTFQVSTTVGGAAVNFTTDITAGTVALAAGPFTWLYAADETADTVQSATVEEGDTIQAYRMVFGLVTNYRFAFSELAAPGNSPWTFESTWLGADKQPVSFAGGAVAVASSGYMMGHLTRAYIGPTSTAFAALSEQVGILAYDAAVPTGIIARKWGGSTDTMDAHGRMQREPTATATFFQTASTKTGVFDVFNTAGAPMIEKRLRIKATGSGVDSWIIDGRVRIRAVPVNESNGATVYAAALEYVYDSTLGTDIAFSAASAVAGLS